LLALGSQEALELGHPADPLVAHEDERRRVHLVRLLEILFLLAGAQDADLNLVPGRLKLLLRGDALGASVVEQNHPVSVALGLIVLPLEAAGPHVTARKVRRSDGCSQSSLGAVP
jgi:hypothetical protein